MKSTSQAQSCLYTGRVAHRRLGDLRHRFSYRVFSLYVDLAELPALQRDVRLFSHNRANLFSFHDRDHGPRDGAPLRPWIDGMLASAGIDLQGGPVRILCFPRLFGYVFNPLSVWFCYHRDGRLRAVLYEVHNTFGEAHSYLIPVDAGHEPGRPIRQRCAKQHFVSPFIGMSARYGFRLSEPHARLSLCIEQSAPGGQRLIAAQTGRRRPLTTRLLLTACLAYPLMTLKVVGAIHWEALRLWLKGAPYRSRPAVPAHPVTIALPATLSAAE